MSSLRVGALLCCVLAVPTLGYAQAQASIAGSVRDTSGAVLPGVTVEASSPELIEKVRSAITDATICNNSAILRADRKRSFIGKRS